jgi:hypothetical protein
LQGYFAEILVLTINLPPSDFFISGFALPVWINRPQISSHSQAGIVVN